MELFSIRIQRTFQLVSTPKEVHARGTNSNREGGHLPHRKCRAGSH